MKDLKDKVVLVTGGGQGLGRAIALAFARQGCRVVISGRHRETLDEVAKEIDHLGAERLALKCDVTERAQVESVAGEIRERLGNVQVLINNAGMAVAAGFLKMDDSLWEEVLKTNLTGTYLCCKVFLPAMIAAGWGRVINIASTVAKVS